MSNNNLIESVISGTGGSGDFLDKRMTDLVTDLSNIEKLSIKTKLGINTTSFYSILGFHDVQLVDDFTVTPTSTTYILLQLELTIPCLANDILEINTSIGANYLAYNDIGDNIAITYTIDAGAVTTTVPRAYIAGGDNSLEVAHGNLYTPLLVTTDGSVKLSVSLSLTNLSQRVFKSGNTGMLVKQLRIL